MIIVFYFFILCILTDSIPPAAGIPPAVGSRPTLLPPVAAGPGAAGRPSFGGGAAATMMAMKMAMSDVVEHTITPHCIKAVYKDSKLRMRICLVILLPSGVTDKSMLKSKVMPDGCSYCLDICILDVVTDPAKFLVLFWASAKAREDSGGDENAALRVSAFNEKMSTMRVSKNAALWRRFKLALDFPVIEDIDYIKLMTKEGSYWLYVELLAQEKSSYMQDGMIEEEGVLDLNSPSDDRKRKAV